MGYVWIVIVILSYLMIIPGSLGMMIFATKFSFSSRINDLELTQERFIRLNGYQL
jgi:hypothetical protein